MGDRLVSDLELHRRRARCAAPTGLRELGNRLQGRTPQAADAHHGGARAAKGPDLPEAIYDSWDKPVEPRSLYLQQLADRLGAQAVKNIGY
jgi:hypothetical protein